MRDGLNSRLASSFLIVEEIMIAYRSL